MLRELTLRVARTRPFAAFVELLARLPAEKDDLAVLTYHRIGDPEVAGNLYPGLISASPAQFTAQMAYVAARHHVIGGEELVRAADGALRLPPRSVLVTFDDAYADFGEIAWPVLRRYRIPAVLFVPTGYPDQNRSFWWDRLYAMVTRMVLPMRLQTPAGVVSAQNASDIEHAFREIVGIVKSLPHREAMHWLESLHAEHDTSPDTGNGAVLGWERLRALADEGVTVAPHSITHPRLDALPDDAIDEEVEGSRAQLSEAMGRPPLPLFAYPDGGYDDRVVRAVRAAGYRAAFTTRRGGNRLRSADWLRLRRINVRHSTPQAMIQAQLVAPWRLLRSSRSPAATERVATG